MIVNNFQLFNLYEGLVQIMNTKLDLPIKIGYALLKNKNILLPMYEAISESIRLISQKEISDEEKNQELTELSNYENDIALEKIKFSEIAEKSLPLDLLEKIYLIIDDEE